MSDRTFPEQIILEIVTRLPAKSAARFKLVSKRFNALISHPHFIRTYLSRAPKTWFLLDRLARVNSPSQPNRSEFVPPPRVSSLSVSFTPENLKLIDDPILLSASNGLVLVACVAKRERNPASFSNVPAQDNLFVFNPVTNEWAGLSNPVRPIERFSAGFTCRVDQLTGLVDRFLVVQCRPKMGADYAMVECFSSETGKWEEMRVTGKWEEMRMWRGDGVFEFGGTLFWIDLTLGLIFLKDDISLLGTGKNYNKQLQFGYIKLPKGCERAFSTIGLEKSRFIGVGGGAELGWIQFLQVQEKGMKLWRLNDYKCGDWSVAYKVSFETEFRGMVPKQLLFHPFEAHVVVCALDGGLLFVNLISKEVQRCASYSNEAGCNSMISAVIPGWPSPLPKMNAEGAKERGNEFFKEKKYEEAVRWYTTSITRSPTAVAYANRAAAYLNLNNFIEAEKDCTDCLYLDEHFLKAYWRRAVARKELGKLGDALEDAEHALKVDPHHAELMKLAGEIKSLLEQGTPVEDVGGSSVSSM